MAELVTDLTERSETPRPVPESFAALVQARLAVLAPGERQLLIAAAVLGVSPAEGDLVPQLVDADPASAAAGWSRGLELNLLIADGDELRWRHGMIRDAVSVTMLPGERQRLRTASRRTDADPADR